MIDKKDLLRAYQKFVKGKRGKKDVQEYILNMESEIFTLTDDIANNSYRHGAYDKFEIYDPKKREIDKAIVRDRIVHQLVSDYLVLICEKSFYFHSYASRKGKGAHKAVKIFSLMLKSASRNNRENIFVLKCDIKKFFASIDHDILLSLINKRKINDQYKRLIKEIIQSFGDSNGAGVPLGNLTSQIFANIYLTELDFYLKQILKEKYYIRYMDDFVIIAGNKDKLAETKKRIEIFLKVKLKLELNDKRTKIIKAKNGVDFLGYVIFPFHAILRTKTKRRMFKKIKIKAQKYSQGLISKDKINQTIQSYLGVLRHADSYKLKQKLVNDCRFRIKE